MLNYYIFYVENASSTSSLNGYFTNVTYIYHRKIEKPPIMSQKWNKAISNPLLTNLADFKII